MAFIGPQNFNSGILSRTSTQTRFIIKHQLPPDAQTCSAMGQQFYAPPSFDLSAIVEAAHDPGIWGANVAVGHYGKYDFQRVKDSAGNTTFYPSYTPVSNIAVGAYLFGAGFTRDEAIVIASTFAGTMSSNAGDPEQKLHWGLGWDLAAAGWNPSCTPYQQ
jgi:hypothetical protein